MVLVVGVLLIRVEQSDLSLFICSQGVNVVLSL